MKMEPRPIAGALFFSAWPRLLNAPYWRWLGRGREAFGFRTTLDLDTHQVSDRRRGLSIRRRAIGVANRSLLSGKYRLCLEG